MNDDRVIQEIIESNEMLRVQMWILGGVIIAMFGMLVWFAKDAWGDVKALLADHDDRITLNEKEIAVQKQIISTLGKRR